MSDRPTAPDECRSMDQVRAGVDALDAEIVALLVRRFEYMRAAARIKPEREQVRDEARKAEVIARVVAMAGENGLPRDLIESLWDMLVEGSIAFELEAWEKAHGGDC